MSTTASSEQKKKPALSPDFLDGIKKAEAEAKAILENVKKEVNELIIRARTEGERLKEDARKVDEKKLSALENEIFENVTEQVERKKVEVEAREKELLEKSKKNAERAADYVFKNVIKIRETFGTPGQMRGSK